MDRFEHVPTPPVNGGNASDSKVDVIASRQIGNGGLWPNASSSDAAPDFNGRESDDMD